jgi:3-oxoacyl-[acyl-carrier-protein] synthase I
MTTSLYLNALGIISALGVGQSATYRNLIAGDQSNVIRSDTWTPGAYEHLGVIPSSLPELPLDKVEFQSRNNQVLYQAALEIEAEIKIAINEYGAQRVGVIIGSSTSGIAESEQAMRALYNDGSFPSHYHFYQQEIGSPSEFISAYFGVKGPVYSVSSACASGGKAFAAAGRLIRANICDAVIVGGADTLCTMTVGGFRSLQALSDEICNPMSQNRAGTNIGEGAAIFLMTKEPGDIRFMGAGESSDAHHISAPEPSGKGAEIAMRRALEEAHLQPDQITYLNMHGTATGLNDSMEAAAISRIFKPGLKVSSSKPMTGHTLGAAGAIEAAFIWLSLKNAGSDVALIPHLWDGVADAKLPVLSLVAENERMPVTGPLTMMSNSFAFGGSNVSVILGREG